VNISPFSPAFSEKSYSFIQKKRYITQIYYNFRLYDYV